MTAFETARQLYEAAGYGAADLLADLEWHASNGYVLATPCEFALARPVALGWGREVIARHAEAGLSGFELTLPLDCWHITVAVGEMRTLLDQLPYPLRYLSYERREVFRVRNLSKILR